MKGQISILILGLRSAIFLVLVFSLIFPSCTVYKEGELIDRSAVQEISLRTPANESEIREIKFNNYANQYGFKDLYINGQLFTKSVVDGDIEIRPCAGCLVILTTPSDSSVKVNMTTEKDGFFSFHGQATIYSVFIDNSGFNRMKINNVSFETGGITTFKIINAAGTGIDNFIISKNGPDYTWSRIQ